MLRSPSPQVFHLGEGTDSKNWLNRNQGDVGRMYLNHIKEIVSFLVTQYWGLRVLLWDDMLRKINVATLRGQGSAGVTVGLPGRSRVHPRSSGSSPRRRSGLGHWNIPVPQGSWAGEGDKSPVLPRAGCKLPGLSGFMQITGAIWRGCMEVSRSHGLSPLALVSCRIGHCEACGAHGVVLRARL